MEFEELSVRTLSLIFLAWSSVIGIIAGCVMGRHALAVIGYGVGATVAHCMANLVIVWPLALFLLVDGEWCYGDCWAMGAVMFPVSLMPCIGAVAAVIRRKRGRARAQNPGIREAA